MLVLVVARLPARLPVPQNFGLDRLMRVVRTGAGKAVRPGASCRVVRSCSTPLPLLAAGRWGLLRVFYGCTYLAAATAWEVVVERSLVVPLAVRSGVGS